MERLDDLQHWWLALAAINVETYGGSHVTLRENNGSAAYYQQGLRDNWSVTSPQTLLETLQWLLQLNHSREFERQLGRVPIAWDIARYVWVVRAAVSAGYITQDSAAWELFEPITAPVACNYGSWRDYAQDFLDARRVWLGDDLRVPETAANHERYVVAVRRLLDPANHASPWRQTGWGTPAGYLVLRWKPPSADADRRAQQAAPEGHRPHRAGEFDQLLRRISSRRPN